MTKKDNGVVSWFVQSYYKPYAATAILSEPFIDNVQESMTMCKIRLCGLKPCDINYNMNEKKSDIQLERPRSSSFNTNSTPTRHEDKITSPQTDYLNLHIKPLATPTNSRSSFSSSDTAHESSPIRVMISETSRGKHRICVSQSLLRSHISDV